MFAGTMGEGLCGVLVYWTIPTNQRRAMFELGADERKITEVIVIVPLV
jgi:hypothetical protein